LAMNYLSTGRARFRDGRKVLLRMFWLLVPMAFACSSSESDGESNPGAGGDVAIAKGGSSAQGGAAQGGAAQGGAPSMSARGGAPASSGGSSSAAGGVVTASGGSASAAGGARAAGGSTAQAGNATGGVPSTPPGPGADGRSPYSQECHGDSLDCGDPALRCLGIRDDSGVAGYSCSNPCNSAADCSGVSSGAAAAAGCLPFVTDKHCLLVCQDDAGTRACPTGMGCYVYPGTTLGYCLWR